MNFWIFLSHKFGLRIGDASYPWWRIFCIIYVNKIILMNMWLFIMVCFPGLKIYLSFLTMYAFFFKFNNLCSITIFAYIFNFMLLWYNIIVLLIKLHILTKKSVSTKEITYILKFPFPYKSRYGPVRTRRIRI